MAATITTGKEIIEYVTTKAQKFRAAKAARDNAKSTWAKQYWQSIMNAHKRDMNAIILQLPDAAVE
jgi:hypothetical protein